MVASAAQRVKKRIPPEILRTVEASLTEMNQAPFNPAETIRTLLRRGWRNGWAGCVLGFVTLQLCQLWSAADGPIRAAPTLATLSVPKARVVAVEQPGAIVTFSPQLPVIRGMFDRGLTALAGKSDPAEAWRTLVTTQDVVGIKVYSAPGSASGTRPAVVEAMVQSLLAAGQPASRIIVWDRQLGPLRLAGYSRLGEQYGIRIEGALEWGYDTNQYYESAFMGQPVWGDHEFGAKGPGVGRKSYVSRLVTQEITKIINVTPMLNHNLAGVSGNLFSLAIGSVDNTVRFLNEGSQLALAVPEIYALPVLGDRVALNVVDALLAQYYGEERSLLHYSAVLNQLRFSTDPVALDVLSIQELERQRALADAPAVKSDLQLYQNASLVEIGVSEARNVVVEWIK